MIIAVVSTPIIGQNVKDNSTDRLRPEFDVLGVDFRDITDAPGVSSPNLRLYEVYSSPADIERLEDAGYFIWSSQEIVDVA